MTNDQPKVSFIPKNSLVREETFLERPRPRSLLGFLAVFSLVASAGSFGVLYFYNLQIEQQVTEKQTLITGLQQEFLKSPDIDRAKAFQTRAELARELLDSHTVVSPVFAFLEANTLASVYYNNFSFARGADGFTVNLSGEAPSYASLAAQSDLLNKKTAELAKFAITDVTLTRYGSVSFSLSLVFTPGYLSYTRDRSLNTGQGASLEGLVPPSLPLLATSTGATSTTPRTGAASSTKTIILPVVPSFSTSTSPTSLEESTLPTVSASEIDLGVIPAPVEALSGTAEKGVREMVKEWLLRFKFW